MSRLTSRCNLPPSALYVTGQLEPIEPVYTEANRKSGLGEYQPVPSEKTTWKAPVVLRGQDTRGMRYLYADMRQKQPISQIGAPGPKTGTAVWNSRFQPYLGTLRDWGFYDLLYRAGYPGFNLGLSFKVPLNPSVGSQAPGHNIHMKTQNIKRVVNVFGRINASASMTG